MSARTCPIRTTQLALPRSRTRAQLVTGANVENASYGLTLCAECALVSKLHTDGLGTRLVAFACVDGAGAPLSPCGRCRQLLFEHGGPGLLLDGPDGPVTMEAMLPWAFGPDHLEER